MIKNFKFSKKKLERIIIIPRGIDPEKFKPEKVKEKSIFNLSKDWELPDGIPIILFPSRIAPFKGHITLLKALSILKKDPKNKFFCIMAGSIKQNSNFIDELKSFIEEYKLENYVKFPGPCLNMPAAYKLCDIVVSPADKPEGFGRIIIEAHAMNRPVIASAHGGSLELIKDNYNGFLFTPTDEFDLANKIAILGLKEGWGVEYIRLTYKRWFQEGKEPAVEPNISEIFKLLNLDHEKTMNEANAEPINNMYEANTNLARQKKIFGSPTFIYEDENFWGDDRMEDSIKWSKN